MDRYVAYVETPAGIWRETDGRMEGPFTREELDLAADQFIPRSGMLRVPASEVDVSLSFGFGYGKKSDNRFA